MSEHLLQLQSKINAYTQVRRRHYLPGTGTREDDSSHSLSVAIICWHYYQLFGRELSVSKILKYALIHDLVEIYAGDVATYASSEALLQKDKDEEVALDRLTEELSFDNDLVSHLIDYQKMADEEASFVWACDKIQAYVQGELDNWRAYLEYPVSKPMFIAKLDSQSQKVPGCLKDEFARLSSVWISSYPEV